MKTCLLCSFGLPSPWPHIGLIICREQPCSTMPCAIIRLSLALPVHTDPYCPADLHSWTLYPAPNIRSLIQWDANINLKFFRSYRCSAQTILEKKACFSLRVFWGDKNLRRNCILYPENSKSISRYILDTCPLTIKTTLSLHQLLHNFSRLNQLVTVEERGRISIIHQTRTSCKTPTLFLHPFNCWLTNVDKHSGKPSASPWVSLPLCHQLSQWACPVKLTLKDNKTWFHEMWSFFFLIPAPLAGFLALGNFWVSTLSS